MISKAGLFHWSCACWPTDGSQEDGEAKDEEMKEEEVKRALIKSIAKGFRGETIINWMFKIFFFLQRLWSFQNPEFQHWNVLDFKEVRFECMRISKNVWEKLVALNTPRLLGPPGLPVILSQSSPILLAFNAPLISGCLGFLKVMSYDYFHGLMFMMFVISCCLFICMYILILCSSIFIYFLKFHSIVYLKIAIRLSRSIWNCIAQVR